MHRGQRGVVRDEIGVLLLRHTGNARQKIVGIGHHRRRDIGVLQANLYVVSADPAGEHRHRAGFGQLFEIDVPQPRHVAPVALLVVHEERDHLGIGVLRDDLEVLVEAGGVLRQVQQHTATGDVERLQPAVLRVEAIDGAAHRVGRASREVGGGGGGQKVVHHVGAGVGGLHGENGDGAFRALERGVFPALSRSAFFALGREAPFVFGCKAPPALRRGVSRIPIRSAHDVEPQTVRAQAHAFGRIIERRTLKPAARAAVRAQLAVLAVLVLHHGGALLAHLRVGHRVLRQSHALGQSERHRRIAHARGDGGAQRVVGVVQKHRVRRGFESARDAVLDTVDLAHAIQLVAEQVEQHHVAGLQMRQYLRQPQLVALEHAPIGRLRVQKGRGHAGVEVRARAVAHHALARLLKDVGQQVRHRGLAVRAHHHERPRAQLRTQVGDEARIHVQRHLAGKVRGGAMEDVLQPPGGDGADGAGGGELNAHERCSFRSTDTSIAATPT